MIIGFAADEAHRIKRTTKKYPFEKETHPLKDMGMTSLDCHYLILDYGLPRPLKSSCFICPFQGVVEWNWLKNNHSDLFQKAIDLEQNFYKRKPEYKHTGLLSGTPLWKLKDGTQPEMFQLQEHSCWSGHCGH